MWPNTHCCVLLDMFSLMLAIGLDWTFFHLCKYEEQFQPIGQCQSMCRDIQSKKVGISICREHGLKQLILNSQCSLSDLRCQNYNSQAAAGPSSSWVSLAAGRARDVAQHPNMTAVLRQGVLWRPLIKVSHLSQETECCINISLLYSHEENYKKK